jgi:hypothetical protein
VILKSRWFPPILALLQTIAYLALVGYDYWSDTRNLRHFNIEEYLRGDLARPLFEPSSFCGAWMRYGFGQTAVLGIDLPAYAAASLLYSAINRQSICPETLTTPRGQVIVALCVFPVWFLVATSIRRLAQHRWRRRIAGRAPRIVISIGLTMLPLGLLGFLLSVINAFLSEIGQALRMAGLVFWMLYLTLLTVERLRMWPFRFLEAQPPSVL